MFQPNHFVPLSNSRQGTKRKDDDESEIGWTQVSPKKSRKQATLKSFLLPKNKTKASSDETQQSSFQPSQKSYPSQPQRQDNKATSTSPGKNGSTTTRQDNHAKMVSQERMKRQHLPFRGRMAPPCRVTKHHLRHQARTTPKRVRSRTPQCSHLPTSRRLYLTHRTGMPVKTTQCQSLTTPKNGIHLQWVTCRINL